MTFFKRFEPVIDPLIEGLKEAVASKRAECERSEQELRDQILLAKKNLSPIPIASAIIWKGRNDGD